MITWHWPHAYSDGDLELLVLNLDVHFECCVILRSDWCPVADQWLPMVSNFVHAYADGDLELLVLNPDVSGCLIRVFDNIGNASFANFSDDHAWSLCTDEGLTGFRLVDFDGDGWVQACMYPEVEVETGGGSMEPLTRTRRSPAVDSDGDGCHILSEST